MDRITAEDLLADKRTNAVLGWLLLLFLGAVAAGSFITGDLSWGIFVTSVLALCLVVPVTFRDPELMLPWELIVLAALPMLGRAIATFEVTSDLNVYLSVAALALIVAVQLDLFTTAKLSVGFAIIFVVLATMATAGVWAVFRWSLDLFFGTDTLIVEGVDEHIIHDELMIEFLYATIAGMIAGVIFELYFRRQLPAKERFSEEVIEP